MSSVGCLWRFLLLALVPVGAVGHVPDTSSGVSSLLDSFSDLESHFLKLVVDPQAHLPPLG